MTVIFGPGAALSRHDELWYLDQPKRYAEAAVGARAGRNLATRHFPLEAGPAHITIGQRAARRLLVSRSQSVMLVIVERVVVLGRGGTSKSTAAKELGRITGLPVIELDAHVWDSDLVRLPAQDWVRRQQEQAGDTVLILDFWLVRCAWRRGDHGRGRNSGGGC